MKKANKTAMKAKEISKYPLEIRKHKIHTLPNDPKIHPHPHAHTEPNPVQGGWFTHSLAGPAAGRARGCDFIQQAISVAHTGENTPVTASSEEPLAPVQKATCSQRRAQGRGC